MRIGQRVMRRCTAFLLCVIGPATGGCGAQGMLLGTSGSHLLTTADALALPGEEVRLRARVQGGDLLRARPGLVVRFYRDGRLFKAAETGGDGVAEVSFTAPKAGDYVFSADVAPAGLGDDVPPPAQLRIACRDADARLVIVDLDKTVVASGFHTVLIGEAAEMPDSPRVLARVAKGRTIVYLTHRPDYFGPKSKAWLKAKGFPPGPVLLSSVSGFLGGSGEYKAAAIRAMRQRFKNVEIGIGDKPSDVAAYHANGLRAFLIVQVPAGDDPAGFDALADEIAALPPAVQVVTTWGQIEKALFDGATFGPSAIEARLRKLADARRKAPPPSGDPK